MFLASSKLDVGFYHDVEQVDLNDYVESNEWTVLGHPASKNVRYYPCCNEPYPDLTFTILLRRKVAFYNYILILPCVLLSSLTLVLFWLPPESPAKMVLGEFAFWVSLIVSTGNIGALLVSTDSSGARNFFSYQCSGHGPF